MWVFLVNCLHNLVMLQATELGKFLEPYGMNPSQQTKAAWPGYLLSEGFIKAVQDHSTQTMHLA